MAKVGEEEVEYESDPEEEKNLLGMRRRRAASDDEEEEEEQKGRIERGVPIQSDESDGQGGAADYEEEDLEEEYEEVYEDEEEGAYEEYTEGAEEREREGEKERSEGKVEGEQNGEAEEGEAAGEKKVNEPSAVPTAGAFYMHDDRFRDNAAGRHRRTYGGRKLWESKDDKKWGHDKFEEMSMQERHYEQGRRGSRGNYGGRGGKNRGAERGYARSSRSKTFSNGNKQGPGPNVRGRGPRKYEPVYKNGSQTSQSQNKQPRKPLEKTSYGNSGRVPPPASNTESDKVQPTKKHSSLSSASPPFYPSGSSNKDHPLTQKGDVEAGSTSRTVDTPFLDETFSMQQGNASSRGKNVAGSVGIEKLYIDDSVNAATGNILNNIQASRIAPSPVNAMQSTKSRVQGRGVAVSGQMAYQASGSHNVGNRISPSTQPHATQRNPSQGRGQTSNQSPGQQGNVRSGSGSRASSPPKSSIPVNSNDPGEAEMNSELSKSRNALVGKGKAGNQGSGRGSFLYGGAQVMGAAGNMGAGHGDQNFPAFLPVMQFGGQHPGGIGVPAVGMAFPGYVTQPQLGLGNSEMTWLPVLAGAAGALGATYCSPYITVDGAYHARSSGQMPSLGSSSKENNTNNDLKPSQKPEVANDEFGQRQKPRRYSEMDFKQPSTST